MMVARLRRTRLLLVPLAGMLMSCTTEFPEEWRRRDARAQDATGRPERRGDLYRKVDLLRPDLLLSPTAANGAPCSSDQTCLSGRCADGVCCDLACKDSCRACNLPGSVGSCLPVPAGQKPAGPGKTCPATAASSCGLDGSCDGVGACRNWPGTTICKPAQCISGNKVKLASFCAAGSCKDLLTGPVSELACDPYKCDAGACLQSCQNKTSCVDPLACLDKKCGSEGLVPIGGPCTAAAQCATGACADGVCCASACAEPCKTCVLEGAKGFCLDVPAGQKPVAGKACAADGLPCGMDGSCDGGGLCRVAPKGTPCGAPQCLDEATGSELSHHACNGVASAPACEKQATTCGNYRCQPSVASCFGGCTGASQCAAGKTCTGYQCR